MALAIIILHTIAGKPLGVRLGLDSIHDTDPPVIIQIDGEKYTVRETKEEIAEIIRRMP